MSDDAFAAFASEGTALVPCAPGAHWQRGVAERHGDIFEHKLQTVIDHVQPVNREEWELCVLHTVNAKNQLTLHHGFLQINMFLVAISD